MDTLKQVCDNAPKISLKDRTVVYIELSKQAKDKPREASPKVSINEAKELTDNNTKKEIAKDPSNEIVAAKVIPKDPLEKENIAESKETAINMDLSKEICGDLKKENTSMPLRENIPEQSESSSSSSVTFEQTSDESENSERIDDLIYEDSREMDLLSFLQTNPTRPGSFG